MPPSLFLVKQSNHAGFSDIVHDKGHAQCMLKKHAAYKKNMQRFLGRIFPGDSFYVC
jgi:hypothetical protein